MCFLYTFNNGSISIILTKRKNITLIFNNRQLSTNSLFFAHLQNDLDITGLLLVIKYSDTIKTVS